MQPTFCRNAAYESSALISAFIFSLASDDMEMPPLAWVTTSQRWRSFHELDTRQALTLCQLKSNASISRLFHAEIVQVGRRLCTHFVLLSTRGHNETRLFAASLRIIEPVQCLRWHGHGQHFGKVAAHPKVFQLRRDRCRHWRNLHNPHRWSLGSNHAMQPC